MKRKLSRLFFFLVLFLGLVAAQWDLPAQETPPTPPADSNAPGSVSGLQRSIFLDLRDINVVDVLKFLALEGNLNIVTSKNVQGRSTLLLKNVTIQDALDIIVISNQLAYDIKNEIIYVMTEDEYLQLYGKNYNDKKKILTRILQYAKPSYVSTALQSIASAIGKVIVDEETGTVIMIDTPEKLTEMNALLDQIEHRVETKIFKLQYANAKDVEAQLRPQLDAKGVGTVFGDSRSNQIILSGYPDRMQEVIPMVQALDKKTKAVLIEARILQLTINPKYDQGINWDTLFKQHDITHIGNLDLSGAFPNTTNLTGANALGNLGKIALGQVGNDDFAFDFQALKQVQKTNLLANPRLMVLDRQEAKINIGDTLPYVITTSTVTGGNVVNSEDVKFINVGLSLVVTPVIHDDDYITIQIRPEVSSRTGTLTTQKGNQIPVVNSSSMESTVVVKNGVTIIMGGLRRDDLTMNNRGVPFLMDIPLLGQLFKNRSETTTKTEIVVFLTPKIVTGGVNMTGEPLDIKGADRATIKKSISEIPPISNSKVS